MQLRFKKMSMDSGLFVIHDSLNITKVQIKNSTFFQYNSVEERFVQNEFVLENIKRAIM
jgi:hypothetical protein